MAKIDRLLLSFLGVLIAHELAYLVSAFAGYDNSIAHGHLKTAWLMGSASLLGLVARSLLRSLRRRKFQPANTASLASSIAAGYFVVEQIERLADGYSLATVLSEPVFWFGIAAAPLVAALLTRSLATLDHVAFCLVQPRRTYSRSNRVGFELGATSVFSLSTVFLSSSISLRGPPVKLSFR